VAHRELQLIRASATRDPRYVARRQAKLKHAERDLERARGRLAKVAA
jgi:hypothetical protein